ncbi:unnamed protein product [Sphagnum troendelagicum]
MAAGNGDLEVEGHGHGEGKMWNMDQTLDQPLGLEAERVSSMRVQKVLPAVMILRLAFQSLGVVYGDLGTSPLYVFRSTFPQGITNQKDVIGALSLIIYTISLIPLLKYMFIVLRANDNGEGGTFALYSLLCRHCSISSLPNRHPTDEELSTFVVNRHHPKTDMQKKLEGSPILQRLLLVLVLIGTSMVIGDGILTPAISVLSAVSGIKEASSSLNDNVVTIISLVIIIGLFSMQRFGTARVGFVFAPIFLLWFISIALIGIYNIIQHDKGIFQAFSPLEIVYFFKRNKRAGWEHLGGVVLCITGTEALFADLGHFTYGSIQIAFSGLVYPSLLLAYLGQGAVLLNHPENADDPFYKSIPVKLYWPMFALATVAAIIASQAIISATFSIVKQSVALGCFPRVKIVHTSDQFQGQIYIPEINWILMILCLVITAGFRDTRQIGNAYGIAVVAVMLVTTYLMTLVIIMVWHKPLVVGLIFLLVFGSVESVYVSSVLFKVKQGGWVPLVIAGALGSIMYVWNYGTLKRYQYENQNKVSVGWVLGLGPSLGLVRVPGVGLVYTDLAHGVPPLFSHFITHLPAIHSTVVFVCIKYLPVNTVPQEERFLVRRIGTKAYSMYRCAARYGYRDLHKRDEHFEQLLFQSLIRFNKFEALRNSTGDNSLAASWTPEERSISSVQALEMAPQNPIMDDSMSQGDGLEINSIADSSIQLQSVSEDPFQEIPATERRGVHFPTSPIEEDTQDALTCLMRGRDAGVTYIIGDTIVKARRDAGFLKKLVINHVYTFLRKTCRENTVALNIPHESLLQVGMIYYV